MQQTNTFLYVVEEMFLSWSSNLS